jgi:hypothetical protein
MQIKQNGVSWGVQLQREPKVYGMRIKILRANPQFAEIDVHPSSRPGMSGA